MADYVWTQTGHIDGYDAVAGADVPAEIEALPSRALRRLLDRGRISVKQSAGAGAGSATPFIPLSATGTDYDAFDDETIDAAWTNDVVPTGSVAWAEGNEVLSAKFSTIAAQDIACKLKPVSISVGGYIETAIRLLSPDGTAFTMAGPVLTDGVVAGSKAVGGFNYVNTAQTGLSIALLTGTITLMGSGGVARYGSPPVVYSRLRWVSANTWRQEISIDGVSWTTFGVADASYAMTPTHMGLFVSNWQAGETKDALASFEYFKAS